MEVVVAADDWVAEILEGCTVVVVEGQGIRCAPPRRGGVLALLAVQGQLVAAMKIQNCSEAVVRVKPARPRPPISKGGGALDAVLRANRHDAGNLPFKIVGAGEQWHVEVANACGVEYREWGRPYETLGVGGGKVSFTPVLSAAQSLNCRGIALHFGDVGKADGIAAAMGATQRWPLSETLTQFRRYGACPLYSMTTCTPLQGAISSLHAVIAGVAEGLGHAPLRVGLFGHAEGCAVAVATALTSFAAGRSGDDLRLLDPWGGVVGSVQRWARPTSAPLGRLRGCEDRVRWGLDLKSLVNMSPDKFVLRSAVFGTPLDRVPQETVDAWMYGRMPPEAVVVTDRWGMVECAQKLAERFDRNHRGGVHRRLDAIAESTAYAFLDVEMCRGRVGSLYMRAAIAAQQNNAKPAGENN